MKKQAYLTIIYVCSFLVIFSLFPCIVSSFNKNFDYGNTAMGKLDLFLNKHIYLDIINWSLFNVIFITLGIYLYKFKKWNASRLIIFVCTYIILACFLLLPIMSVLNIFLMTICKNPPIYPMEEKVKLFPISQTLEQNHEVIKKEYLAFHGEQNCAHTQTIAFRIGTGEVNGGCWRMIILKQAGVFKDVAQHFPTTANLLKDDSIHNAIFSSLDANVNIPPHIGYYKGYLRYHLGVEIPQEPNGDNPFIIVGDQKYYWKEGEGVLFDDMFYHHVKNPTPKRRTVLYIDVIRPLSQPLDAINRGMIKLIENNPVIKYIIAEQHKQVVNLS